VKFFIYFLFYCRSVYFLILEKVSLFFSTVSVYRINLEPHQILHSLCKFLNPISSLQSLAHFILLFSTLFIIKLILFIYLSFHLLPIICFSFNLTSIFSFFNWVMEPSVDVVSSAKRPRQMGIFIISFSIFHFNFKFDTNVHLGYTILHFQNHFLFPSLVNGCLLWIMCMLHAKSFVFYI